MQLQFEYMKIVEVMSHPVDLVGFGKEGWRLCAVVWEPAFGSDKVYIFGRAINLKQTVIDGNEEMAQEMRDLRQQAEENQVTMNLIARALHPHKPVEERFTYVPSQLSEMITRIIRERDDARSKLYALRAKVIHSLQTFTGE